MNPIVLLGLGLILFIAIGLLVFAFTRSGDAGDKMAQTRLTQIAGGLQEEKKNKKKDGKKQGSQLAKNLDEAMESRGFIQKTQTQLAQANLKITATEFILITFMAIVVCAALAFIIFHRQPIMALAGAVAGFFLPRMYLNSRKKDRLKKFNNQLGDSISLMANGLRSGYSILQAMESVGTEMADPIAEEFRRVVREIQLGVTNENAMNNMVRRVPSDDLDLMVTAINVQHEVGGNLAEILEVISLVIRERVRIAGEVATLTAQGMMSGYVISLLPIVLGLILFAMNQTYIGRMVFACEDPANCKTQPCGWIMTGGALLMILLGFTAIKKIVKIEV